MNHLHTVHVKVNVDNHISENAVQTALMGIPVLIDLAKIKSIKNEMMSLQNVNTLLKLDIPFRYNYSIDKELVNYVFCLKDTIDSRFKQLVTSDKGDSTFLSSYLANLPVTSPLRATYDGMVQEEDPNIKLNYRKFLINQIKPGTLYFEIDVPSDDTAKRAQDILLANASKDESNFGLIFTERFVNQKFGSDVSDECLNATEFPMLKSKYVGVEVSSFHSAKNATMKFSERGIWISQIWICDGVNSNQAQHTGELLGPVFNDIKFYLNDLRYKNFELLNESLIQRCHNPINKIPIVKVIYKDELQHHEEHQFLTKYYNIHTAGLELAQQSEDNPIGGTILLCDAFKVNQNSTGANTDFKNIHLLRSVQKVYVKQLAAPDAGENHLFIRQLKRMIDYLELELAKTTTEVGFQNCIHTFIQNLFKGIAYYHSLLRELPGLQNIVEQRVNALRKEEIRLEQMIVGYGLSYDMNRELS